ncbi:pyridoxal phosphate-dependent aminotransferase [Metabacillus fastidiosus]|uniref:Aminotransferase n=1 Tax=Metabacillus fastidiosus TaxID=1458 RepID=A0ABU6NUD6_9BACI|nr:aminotransferase class I/II-fold pyridoxal phosphate-dependent enzyme [Metabacillus fastidiosus]MED4400755.1 aminotransferase class I/II-fold pyridoxal phosphate-dependent enzyme [Metabacillus fastidiosus]MED4462926.1 aminotransferase class I/II-fold pyridoxal phosphate-dependent enzyme [Metabacillus fastidiosus]
MTLPLHGANPQFLYEVMNVKMPEKIIDFSVNTNPFAINDHFEMSDISAWISEYPDPNCTQLKKKYAEELAVKEGQLLFGNGASQCIFLLAENFQGKAVGIIEPTFNEYRRACDAFQCTIHTWAINEQNEWQVLLNEFESFLKEIDVLFLCNPNNPTGTIFSNVDEIIKLTEKYDVSLIIDEAFYDFCESGDMTSLHNIHQYEHLIILRSVTKMYNLAGARLGYIIAQEKLINELNKKLPTWSVNGIAQQLGLQAVERMDKEVLRTRKRINDERKRVCEKLGNAGFYTSSSVTNYYLLRERVSENAHSLLIYLLQNGAVVRHTENFAHLNGKYIRIAVKTKAENDFLLALLEEWKNR